MLTFFTPFDVKMIQISTFPAAPSTERVPSLAERVASLRYSINLQLLNNRVPGLLNMLSSISNTMLFHQILPCFSQITSNLSLYININSLTHCRFFLNISGAQQCSSLVLRAIYRSRLIIVSPTHSM